MKRNVPVIVSTMKVLELTNESNEIFVLLDTDTDFSESEALSSLQISGQVKSPPMSPPSHSESGI